MCAAYLEAGNGGARDVGKSAKLAPRLIVARHFVADSVGMKFLTTRDAIRPLKK